MIQIIISFLIADFITGFFHWFEDAYATKDWWFNIGKDNIQHHKQPGLIGRMGTFISRNLVPICMAIVVAPILYLFGIPLSWILLISFFSAMGNEVHAWNHRAKNNLFITYLQEACIIQTKHHHAKHHKPPYTNCYCILSNLLNPILDYVMFWSWLEYVLSKIGLKVKRGTEARDFL